METFVKASVDWHFPTKTSNRRRDWHWWGPVGLTSHLCFRSETFLAAAKFFKKSEMMILFFPIQNPSLAASHLAWSPAVGGSIPGGQKVDRSVVPQWSSALDVGNSQFVTWDIFMQYPDIQNMETVDGMFMGRSVISMLSFSHGPKRAVALVQRLHNQGGLWEQRGHVTDCGLALCPLCDMGLDMAGPMAPMKDQWVMRTSIPMRLTLHRNQVADTPRETSSSSSVPQEQRRAGGRRPDLVGSQNGSFGDRTRPPVGSGWWMLSFPLVQRDWGIPYFFAGPQGHLSISMRMKVDTSLIKWAWCICLAKTMMACHLQPNETPRTLCWVGLTIL